MKNKKKLLSYSLFIMVIILIISAFYITKILIDENGESKSNIAPRKTKAADISYTKSINIGSNSAMPSPTLIPSLVITVTPSPTEIILAQGPTITETKTASNEGITATITVILTKINSLPITGFMTNAVIIFATASLFIFFSFLF